MTWAVVALVLALVFLVGKPSSRERGDALARIARLEGESRRSAENPDAFTRLVALPYSLSPPALRRVLASGLESLERGEGGLGALAGARAWLALAAPALVLLTRFSPAGLLLAVPAAAGAALLPAALSSRRRARYLREVARDLPQAADILYAYVLGGRNLDQAYRSAAGEAPGALGELMRQTVREMDLGATRQEAFRRAVSRAPLPELSSLLGSVVEAERRGFPLSTTLSVFAREIRLRRRDELRATVARAPLKMLAPLVFLILPASVLLTVGPTMLVTLTRLF